MTWQFAVLLVLLLLIFAVMGATLTTRSTGVSTARISPLGKPLTCA